MNLKVDGAYTLVAGVRVNITRKEALRLLAENSDTFTSNLVNGCLMLSVKEPVETADENSEQE